MWNWYRTGSCNLYVITRSTDNIIIIDEPNSFLHPRAAKALMAILRGDNRNQFIVTTHSPEIIAASEPERFFMLGYANEQTKIDTVERRDLDSVRQVLDEIGSRLSDVFGADRVLWVEGPTEVECFPLLMRAANRDVGAGLAIAPLRATGDLEARPRHVEIVADIYRNLSSAHSVLPQTAGLSLDGDKRDLSSKDILRRAFGVIPTFLTRRCYENYLLHPLAISSLLNTLPGFQTESTTQEAVAAWMNVRGRSPAFKASEHAPFSPSWYVEVDAPSLLEALFQDLSAAKEIYRKPLHSIELTRWLLEHDVKSIDELVNYVVALLPSM